MIKIILYLSYPLISLLNKGAKIYFIYKIILFIAYLNNPGGISF